jgi:hypothetical protein
VAYAFVQDVPASWQHYQQTLACLLEPAPAGLILHAAGPTAEGVRVIDIWTTEEAWERFRAERLAPAIAVLGGPARPESTFRNLYPGHLVLGEQPRRR